MQQAGVTTWLMVALIIIVWPVFFIVLWSGIIFLMSVLGGWRRLARRYRTTEKPVGSKSYPFVSGMVGIARYKRVLTITIADEGMFIEIRWIFRIGHPALFIPWQDIHDARKITLFYWEYVGFEVGSPVIARMRLPSQVFDATPVFID